ncbi:MAG: hypothetical protein AAGA99_11740 [Actinomycetota bacterium]
MKRSVLGSPPPADHVETVLPAHGQSRIDTGVLGAAIIGIGKH